MPSTTRVTVALPRRLVERIDRLDGNRGRFIAEAIEHELAARGRAALLQSLARPNLETAFLVETKLVDWLADLPTGESLVDPTAGTPVRWTDGQGWTREPEPAVASGGDTAAERPGRTRPRR